MTDTIRLQTLDHIPEPLYQAEPTELLALLGQPTLIHLPGRRTGPLFVSVLLHGNEDTSWLALRELLNRYRGRELPRALSIFIGNVSAASQGLRRLDGQPDYNRVWPGSEESASPEHAIMTEVVAQMRQRQPFASIDVHNNTGLNPHYACINQLDHRFYHLATLFSRTVIYFLRPLGVQSMAFAELCPSVTVECGQAGHASNTDHALQFLDAALHLAEHPGHAITPHGIDLYHTVATIKVRDDIDFGFQPGDHPLTLLEDLDHMNFKDLPVGTVLGYQRTGDSPGLQAFDETGNNVSADYFQLTDGELQLRRHATPAMLTLNQRVIRQDCLCYLMERLPEHVVNG